MLSEGVEDVATVMKRISVSYVYYFNKKYKRVGHLFQDRFITGDKEFERVNDKVEIVWLKQTNK